MKGISIMKQRYSIVALLCMSALSVAEDAKQVPDSAFMIDTIQAVVFSPGGTQVLTRSDVTRPSLSGAQQTLDELIFERLVFMDAQKYKIVPDDDALDKYLAIVQKENNLTLDQLKEVFSSAGYTYAEGREQFKVLQTVNSMLDFKIRSQVIVPRKLVEEYYEQNPVIQEAKSYVQYGFIPYANGKLEAQKKALAYMARAGKEVRDIQWGEPFWVKQNDVADDKAFLFSMKPGEISRAKDRGDGFEVYKVLEASPERIATFDERYAEIADILRRPLFEDLMEKYRNSLFDSVSILNFG